MENTSEVRIRRSEQDIETLRKTQDALLNRYDGIYKTLVETRDIADENRQRLESIEKRLYSIENRQKQMEDRQKRMEDLQNSLEQIALEHSAAILEVHNILLSIADSLDLTLEKPSGKD